MSLRALLLLAVILLGFALRIIQLQFQPLWWDEGYSVWFATHPIGQMLALTAEDIHPPLYYALLHGWTLLAGAGPVAIRLFSVAVGVLAIPAVYIAGRRLFDRQVALLAACLLAAGPMHIYYSQEVRMYGLVALLAALLLAVAWPILRSNRPPWRSLAGYVVLATATLYTQYYAVFLPIGLTLYALWRWWRQPAALGRWLLAQAVVALLYVPWLAYATPRLIPYVSQKVVADADRPLALLPYIARHLAAFIAGHLQGALVDYWPLALLLLLPLATGLIFYVRDAPRGTDPDAMRAVVMLLVLLATSLAFGYAISTRYPFFPTGGERLLLLALPAFTLLAGAALAGLWRRRRLAGLAGALLLGFVALASLWTFYTVPRYPGDDYRPLLARVVEQGRPGDTVFAVYPWQVGYWRSYGDANGPEAVLTPQPGWGPAVSGLLDQALQRGHLWFPAHLALGGLLEARVENYLSERSRPFLNQWYGPGTRLSAWSADEDGRAVALPGGQVRFALSELPGGYVTLLGASAGRAPVPAENATTPLTLEWEAATRPPALAASIRLVDDLGHLWAQHDYELLGAAGVDGSDSPPGWKAQDRLALLVPAGTPPGNYHLELALRRSGSDQPLDVVAADGTRGTSVRLADLAVAPAVHELGPERLPVAQRSAVDLEGGVRFLGYSADESPLVPGGLRKVNLFWQATSAPPADYQAFVQLVSDPGKPPVAAWEAPPGAAAPTSQWSPGTLIRTQADLRAPADLPDGAYRLIAGLFRTADGRRLRTPEGADHVDLGTVTVRGRQHSFTPPAPAHPAAIDLAPFARLAGYDVEPTASPDGQIPLTLYWQATATAPKAYKVFLHLLGPGSRPQYGAGDAEPGGGALPTTGWVAGEYLTDRHVLSIDPGTPPGEYRISIGLYDPATGERLRLPDGSDHIELDTRVQVR